MSSNDRAGRGLPLPTVGTCALVAAVLGAAWFFWTDSGARRRSREIDQTSDEAVTRIQALEALIARGRDSVPELMSALSDPDPKARHGALVALARIGPQVEQALPFVQGALQDPDAIVRSSAVTALARINGNAETAVPVIAPLLADPAPQVRDASFAALVQMGAAARDRALRMLRSESPAARTAALRFLLRAHNGWPAPEVVAAARQLTADPDEEVRVTALEFVVRSGWGTPNDLRELRAIRDRLDE